MEQVAAYIRENADRYLEELKQLLRIQTVSADSAFLPEMKKGAEFVRDRLRDAGCTAELVPTAGHPIVYGEWLGAPGAPTVLVYGHYDVQPPDPLDQWITPAFEPTVRDGKIYARGATDDKGQMYTHIKSVEAWHKATGRLPVNVKFVIEGEEEVGSDHLTQFLEEHKSRLKADVAVISDTSQYAPGIPAVTYGLRGIMACEVRLKGPNQDLHSGTFGGSVANPANILAKLVASLHDDQGSVRIPGFYDDVVELTDAERKQFAALPFDEAQYLKSLGVAAGHGEAGYTSTERRWARPTCDVNGFHSGYAGEGPKTIVPARAFAKITCRLVPKQNPKKLVQALEQYLRRQCPAGVEFTFIDQHGCAGLVMDPDSPYMEAAKKAIAAAFGREPVLIREGGSIPVVATFGSVLGLGTLLLGWGQNTDNLHSPNEHFSLADYQRGIQASAFLWGELGGSQ